MNSILISGFTIIRNGLKFDFPFIESILSILPICDEFVINIGISEDDTKKTIQDLISDLPENDAKKIKIIENDWPLGKVEKRQGGQILADQTNLALDQCQGVWCFYLQADEIVHEEDLLLIRSQLEVLKNDSQVESLVFQYIHFYATYDTIQTSRSAYRREIRVIRNRLGIRSTGDAQSFRHSDGRKLNAVLTRARIFHYGWVRPQEVMRQKTGFMDTLYHQNASSDKPQTGENYLYKRFVGQKRFTGTHPKVMHARVQNSQTVDFSKAPFIFQIKDSWKILSGLIEQTTGIRPFEYKNYRLLKKTLKNGSDSR